MNRKNEIQSKLQEICDEHAINFYEYYLSFEREYGNNEEFNYDFFKDFYSKINKLHLIYNFYLKKGNTNHIYKITTILGTSLIFTNYLSRWDFNHKIMKAKDKIKEVTSTLIDTNSMVNYSNPSTQRDTVCQCIFETEFDFESTRREWNNGFLGYKDIKNKK